MDFLEFPCFPVHLAQQVMRSVFFLTEVVQLMNGCEQRNTTWSRPLTRYDLTANAQSVTDCQHLDAFFQAVHGRWLPFRFKDPLDFSSAEGDRLISPTDQKVGRGDGVQRAFQLIKTTKVGEQEQVRVVQKPVPGTVVVAVNGSETPESEVDSTTGVVTFLEPPPLDALITAGFAFDIPCRFDSDQLAISLQPPHLGSLACALLEVRLPRISLIITPLSEITPEGLA